MQPRAASGPAVVDLGPAGPTRPGEALRRARLRAGISQQLLGLMTGTTQQNVSRWEKGLGAPEPAVRIALRSILELPEDIWTARHDRAVAGRSQVRHRR